MLAIYIILTLSLTACTEDNDTPTGDDTSSGVTDNGSTPSSTETPEVNKAAEYEAGRYVETYKAGLDESLADISRAANIDVENVIDEIY